MHKKHLQDPDVADYREFVLQKKKDDDERRPTRERGYLKACCNETRCCCDGILTGVVVLNDRT